jgi:hypothetical protein
MSGAMLRTYDVERLVAPFKSFHDEWHEHAVFFFLGVEESTGMAGMGKGRTGQVHGTVFGLHIRQ